MSRRPRYRVALLLGFVLAGTTGPQAAPGGAGASGPAALPGAEPFPPALRARLTRALASRSAESVARTRHRNPDGSPRFTNRLILESSPYLRQHAHNPVDWHPWGDEPFELARRLNRPVLVSIGYSTCHWCHVMEEESYDDPKIAALLNANFVAVKVDREVRPDVDAIYMTALHALTGGGGWPLNVWVTPDREPFHGGTYFPPEDQPGRPGFTNVLRAIHEAWREEPEQVTRLAARVSAAVREHLGGTTPTASQLPHADLLHHAKAQAARRFDAAWGGEGQRPKFPARLPTRFLLRYHRRTGDAEALRMVTLTLEKMAAGGIHDQIGGGFHRYSIDRRWHVPHFEKMLYDNALRAVEYLEAWQVTGREEFAAVVRSTLAFVLRDMTSPEGAFYSATDADSPGPDGRAEEGLFFTWTPEEIRAALDVDTARAALAWWSVTEPGELEGRSVLRVTRSRERVARELEIEPDELGARIRRARERLLEVRSQRPAPHRDEKILAAWNGLMIWALARAGFALDEPRWTRAAARAADFALTELRPEGRLHRVFADGRAEGTAFLEDHAFLIAGLLDLYQVLPEPRWIEGALALQRELDAHYADTEGGGYFRTPTDHERLLTREKPASDGALPSGNSVAALNLLRLHELTGQGRYRAAAGAITSAFYEILTETPTTLNEMLVALDAQLDTMKQIVLVSGPGGDGSAAMLGVLRSTFVPNGVFVHVTQGANLRAHARRVPLLAGKTARDGRATAYVCENRVCQRPTSDPTDLARQIRETRPLGRGS